MDTSQPTQPISPYRAHPLNPVQKEKCSESHLERQCANIFACIPKYSKFPVPGTAYQVLRKGHCNSTGSDSQLAPECKPVWLNAASIPSQGRCKVQLLSAEETSLNWLEAALPNMKHLIKLLNCYMKIIPDLPF